MNTQLRPFLYSIFQFAPWGYVEFNKALVKANCFLNAVDLFCVLKESGFQLLRVRNFPSETARQYVLTTFGNYHAADIHLDHFALRSKKQLLDLLADHIQNNPPHGVAIKGEMEAFQTAALSTLEAVSSDGSTFYALENTEGLSTLFPDGDGPHSHFMAFLIFGSSERNGDFAFTITVIKVGCD